eukprot:751163-Hanusia_phi.AAC.3
MLLQDEPPSLRTVLNAILRHFEVCDEDVDLYYLELCEEGGTTNLLEHDLDLKSLWTEAVDRKQDIHVDLKKREDVRVWRAQETRHRGREFNRSDNMNTSRSSMTVRKKLYEDFLSAEGSSDNGTMSPRNVSSSNLESATLGHPHSPHDTPEDRCRPSESRPNISLYPSRRMGASQAVRLAQDGGTCLPTGRKEKEQNKPDGLSSDESPALIVNLQAGGVFEEPLLYPSRRISPPLQQKS